MSYSMTAAIRTAIRIHPIPETDMHDPNAIPDRRRRGRWR